MAQEPETQIESQSEAEIQEVRAFLRERYLYVLSNLCVSGMGDCDIAMFEKTKVKCQVKAFDLNFENVIVENLITPMPAPINKAILRTSDIISMHFNCDYTQLLNKF